jgi:hypothetical protein
MSDSTPSLMFLTGSAADDRIVGLTFITLMVISILLCSLITKYWPCLVSLFIDKMSVRRLEAKKLQRTELLIERSAGELHSNGKSNAELYHSDHDYWRM